MATILAKTGAQEPSLLLLLDEKAEVSESAKLLKKKMQESAGLEVEEEEPEEVEESDTISERRVVPQSVRARQLANPFLAPDFSLAEQRQVRTHRLAGWELLGPLFRSFEYAGDGAATSMHAAGPEHAEAARRPRADAAPGPADRRGRRRATAPSCSPTSPASARPPRRCSRPRPPTPTRCWWSPPTW